MNLIEIIWKCQSSCSGRGRERQTDSWRSIRELRQRQRNWKLGWIARLVFVFWRVYFVLWRVYFVFWRVNIVFWRVYIVFWRVYSVYWRVLNGQLVIVLSYQSESVASPQWKIPPSKSLIESPNESEANSAVLPSVMSRNPSLFFHLAFGWLQNPTTWPLIWSLFTHLLRRLFIELDKVPR